MMVMTNTTNDNTNVDMGDMDMNDMSDMDDIPEMPVMADVEISEEEFEMLDKSLTAEPSEEAVSGKLTKEEIEQYAEENMRLIPYVLKGLYNTDIPYDELHSVGVTGYTKALVSFDKTKGAKFSTYAINCIRNEILFFLRKENKYMQNTTSLNTILANDKNGNSLELEETISMDELNDTSLEDAVLEDETRQLLLKAIDELNDKEKLIIIYRFGLDRGIKKTQKELADEINMSQANVSKIQEKALKKLKVILKKYL